ncbi:HigA family addiction module antitoxin [Grimontia hollisae]|uniref:Antitoxin HigA-1 n=1 Tax=Grimontia hollisae TaxID=673 RepID=A0A377J8X4_GRIHO|nr:HigA family addiction module antitoxin [Grimontia hollisae]STO98960.1 Antitoxin HigA-1 [Grimontia hollisae]
MRHTKRKPVTVGEMLKLEFLEPMEIKNAELAQRIGVHRNTISNLVNNNTVLTAPLAIKLAAAFGNSPEFWLNIQHAVDIWETRNSAVEAEGIEPFIARMAIA